MSDNLDPNTLREALKQWNPKDGWELLPEWLETELAKAEAPPETGYTTDDWLAEADDLIQFHEGEGHETAFVDRDEYKTMKALRQIVTTLRADVARLTEQVREWRAEAEAAGDRARAEAALRREVEAERDAALATATEAAETVARLTAERDAARLERDSVREQFDRHVEWASEQEQAARAQVWADPRCPPGKVYLVDTVRMKRVAEWDLTTPPLPK